MDEGDGDVYFKGEPSSPSGDEPDLRAFLLHALAQEDQPAFQIIFKFRETQPRIHPKFAVGELGSALVSMAGEQAPENAARHVPDQIVAIHKHTVVYGEKTEMPGRPRPPAIAGRLGFRRDVG